MRSAALGLMLLSAAAPALVSASPSASPAPAIPTPVSASPPLNKRTLRLLIRIRAEAAASAKNPAQLRADLGALEAENRIAHDPQAAVRLSLAEKILALLEAGKTLPPPSAEEADDGGQTDDAPVSAPTPAASRAPVLNQIASAGGPEVGGTVFDGAGVRSGASAVGVPTPPAASDLGDYLALEEGEARKTFLRGVAADLLVQLKAPDEDGERAHYLGWRLGNFLSFHPDRGEFVALSVQAAADETLHLIYTLRGGEIVDQELGTITEWTTPKYAKKPKDDSKIGDGGARGGGGGGKKKKKSAPSKPPKKGDGEEGGGSSSKSKKKGHGGGGGGGGGGGSGGGGGGGGHAGRSHAKVPHSGGKGGFDGGGSEDSGGGDSIAGGSDGGHRARGARRERGGASGVSRGEASSGAGGAGARATAHVRAGRRISGDAGSEGRNSSSARGPKSARGTSVPLPKDFTTRGGGSRLGSAGGGSFRGGGDAERSGGRGRLHAPVLPKTPHDGSSPAGSGPAATAPAVLAANGPTTSAHAPQAAAGAASAPSAPLTIGDEELHDAVAAHAAGSGFEPAAVPLKPSSSPPAQQEPASSPWPLAAGVTGLFFVTAAAFLRNKES
jgi:hypothetical protein